MVTGFVDISATKDDKSQDTLYTMWTGGDYKVI
jgi:hypothetical protein